MYRFVSRTVCLARNPSSCVYVSCLPKREKVSRAYNRVAVKAVSTSSSRLCEKKDNTNSAHQDEAEKKEGSRDKMNELEEDGGVMRADDGRTTQAERVKTSAPRSGKENLLDLLGAMKVEVTNKRKLKSLKTKSESATKYAPKPPAIESTIRMFQKATAADTSSESGTLEPDLVAAASAAAATLPNSRQAEWELLQQLRQRKDLTEAQRKGDGLGDIVADMKVGKKFSHQNSRLSSQIRFDEDGQGYTHDRGITSELASVQKRKRLFRSKRLNIFSPVTDKDTAESALSTKPTLWDTAFVNELSSSTNQMPRNGFEEMIQWTKEGKLWQYPINNESGLEEEVGIPFTEHVFLEIHLEEGFPRQGPVRHFMELVVAGLSRNPYLTVQQKKEHISWFRDYFHQKAEVLNEAGVCPS